MIQNASTPKVERQLRQLVETWHRAIAARDTATLETIWDDSYVSTGPDGTLITKEQELAAVAAPELRFRSLVAEDIEVRMYGETAVVLGRSVADGAYQEHDLTGAYRFTSVFVRRPEGWRAVVSQGTQVQ